MSSRRKSTTPCMIRPQEALAQEDMEVEESGSGAPEEGPPQMDMPGLEEPSAGETEGPPQLSPVPQRPESDPRPPQRKQQGGGYECKYCSFSTQNLNEFKEHVDANHPNVILNPLYLCAVCNFNTKKFDTLTEHNDRCHPGETNFKFKRVKLNNQTILEQTIEGSSNAVVYGAGGASTGADIATFPLSKPTTVKIGKPRTDNKRILPDGQAGLKLMTPELSKKQITAVNVNGTVIIPEASLKDGLSHIMPSLQRPPNYNLVPKIAVPLNTSKYNPSLDGNLTLITSFNKFPYPTQAELSWLTAASKHPEEQIKVWFTTQRLKQGISWSPEEVEEARKKMFNGTIQSMPQTTFTVLPAQLTPQSTKASQSLLQTLPCQLLGQTSLVLTPVANGSTVTCAPIALTLANQVAQSIKRPLVSPVVVATEIKRPSIIQTVQMAPKFVPPKLNFTADSNKTPDQLAVLKASYTQCQFPEEDEVYRLIETTGLSRGEIKKWFSEQRLLNLKGAMQIKKELPSKDGPPKITIPTKFPLLERVKGKSSEQLKTLEESFHRSSSPTDAEVAQLAENTRLSKMEIDCWFSERKALRDNMEQALLNSMGPKVPDEQRGVLNGVHEQQDTKIQSPSVPLALVKASASPETIDARLLSLLKEMFTQTQWPSPEQYNHLEVQTGLVRTDIVRWFKDNRSALKNGSLEWMEQFQKLNNKGQNDQSPSANPEKALSVSQPPPAKVLKLEEEADKMPERSKLQPVSNQELVQWFTNKLGQSMSDLSRARDQPGQAVVDRGRWVKVTMAVDEEGKGLDMQRLGPEAEVLALDHPGRVTG